MPVSSIVASYMIRVRKVSVSIRVKIRERNKKSEQIFGLLGKRERNDR